MTSGYRDVALSGESSEVGSLQITYATSSARGEVGPRRLSQCLNVQSPHRKHQIHRTPVLLQRQHELLLILARLRVSQRELQSLAKVLQIADRRPAISRASFEGAPAEAEEARFPI